MRVDVLISGSPPNSTGNNNTQQTMETQTLLQNIEVLSAGTDYQKDAQGKPQQVQVVNLLVTPDQAETLSLAANTMKIQLVLRNPMDTQIAKVPPEAMTNLFPTEAPGAPKNAPRRAMARKPAPKTYSITVSNGSKTTQEKFPVPGGQQ
jgi:pilus assembly protein CpaB